MGGWVGMQKLITDLDMRNGHNGGHRFSSLVKQKEKGKIALSFASPEKENFIYIFMM